MDKTYPTFEEFWAAEYAPAMGLLRHITHHPLELSAAFKGFAEKAWNASMANMLGVLQSIRDVEATAGMTDTQRVAVMCRLASAAFNKATEI